MRIKQLLKASQHQVARTTYDNVTAPRRITLLVQRVLERNDGIKLEARLLRQSVHDQIDDVLVDIGLRADGRYLIKICTLTWCIHLRSCCRRGRAQ